MGEVCGELFYSEELGVSCQKLDSLDGLDTRWKRADCMLTAGRSKDRKCFLNSEETVFPLGHSSLSYSETLQQGGLTLIQAFQHQTNPKNTAIH